jgi:isocitrate/isopropylmalate dehydrogenase
MNFIHNAPSPISNEAMQYVKDENLIQTENGKEARATRLITERASTRIGKIAFELAKARPRKVFISKSLVRLLSTWISAAHDHPQIQCFVGDRRALP